MLLYTLFVRRYWPTLQQLVKVTSSIKMILRKLYGWLTLRLYLYLYIYRRHATLQQANMTHADVTVSNHVHSMSSTPFNTPMLESSKACVDDIPTAYEDILYSSSLSPIYDETLCLTAPPGLSPPILSPPVVDPLEVAAKASSQSSLQPSTPSTNNNIASLLQLSYQTPQTIIAKSVLHPLSMYNNIIFNGMRHPMLPFTLMTSSNVYVCNDVIGYGSSGTVFKTSCERAIKFMHISDASYTEAVISTQIRNDYITPTIEVGHVRMKVQMPEQNFVDHDFVFLIMPLAITILPCVSLKSTMLQSKLDLIKNVFVGLSTLHSHHYAHGDLHPKNILIFKQHAALCDFNLSINVKAPWTRDTKKDIVTCTLPFSSPLSVCKNRFFDQEPSVVKMIIKASGVEADERNYQACDVFCFGQLITYILFDAESFLCGNTIFDVEGSLKQYKEYCTIGSYFFESYFVKQCVKGELVQQIREYRTIVGTRAKITVESLNYVLRLCLSIKESERCALQDIQSHVMNW